MKAPPRGQAAKVTESDSYETFVDRCQRCSDDIVTNQHVEQPRVRYRFCAVCAAKLVAMHAALGLPH